VPEARTPGCRSEKIGIRRPTRKSCGGDRIDVVIPPTHIRLILDLDLAADPIGGVVGPADGGAAEPFAGWIALTRTIELSLDGARRRLPSAQAADRPMPPESE
jgi:hypothetical protein